MMHLIPFNGIAVGVNNAFLNNINHVDGHHINFNSKIRTALFLNVLVSKWVTRSRNIFTEKKYIRKKYTKKLKIYRHSYHDIQFILLPI